MLQAQEPSEKEMLDKDTAVDLATGDDLLTAGEMVDVEDQLAALKAEISSL